MTTLTKVLIVEADHSSASQIKNFIEAEGYEVVQVVTDGMSALQALSSVSFDLAIIDSGLPDSWSETLLHALGKKNLPAPLVLVNLPDAKDTTQIKIKYPQASFLPKPFYKTQLLEAASKAVKTKAA